MIRRKFVWIALASIAIVLAAWTSWQVVAENPDRNPKAGPREYGVWDRLPDADPIPSSGVPEGSPAEVIREDPSELSAREKEIAAERIRRAEANRVMGRPAAPFDAGRLHRLGFGDDEIDRIQRDFSDYASALRAESEGERIVAAYQLDPEERESRRRLRERYLTDREFDAALFATNQANRVEIVRLRQNARTWKVGLRPRDQIISINGVRVFDLPDFEDGRARREEGQLHDVLVLRGDKVFDVNVQCCRAGWSGLQVILARPLPESVER